MSAAGWLERTDLACLGNGNTMTGPEGEPPRERELRQDTAVWLCTTCPALDQCHAWVMAQDPDPCPHSVVAAMRPGDRRRARAAMKPPVPIRLRSRA